MCRCRTTSSSSGSRSPVPTVWSPPRAASSTSTDSPHPMATNVYMEALSPTMEEGRVVKWHKHEGDPVKTGETLAEVETDKAVMDRMGAAKAYLGRPRPRLPSQGAGSGERYPSQRPSRRRMRLA